MFEAYSRRKAISIVRRPTPLVLVMLIPSLFLVILFNYIPIGQSLFFSLYRWSGGATRTFRGLSNYVDLFSSEVFHVSMYNQLIIVATRTILLVMPPLIVARLIFALKSRPGFANFFRLMFVVPIVIPPIVVLLIWQFMYDGQVGLFNTILRSLSLGQFARGWLGDPRTALGAIIAIGFPWVEGINMLIFLAGFLSVDNGIWDSVLIDGANPTQRFFRIDLPLIVGQLKLVLVLTLIKLMQDFVGIMILTRGGPGTSTMVPGLLLYQNAFSYGRMGYANAIGVVMFFILLSLSILSTRIGRE